MKSVLLSLAAGALLALSLPPYNVEWLGWIALAPLLAVTSGRRALEAMGFGMLAGGACGVLHVGWHPDTHGLQFAYLPFLWLALLLGVVTALAARARQWLDGTRWTLCVVGAGVAAEWLTTFSPLPLNLAICQHRTLPVIQIASLTGVWGVSFLLWWSNAAVADAALGLIPRKLVEGPRQAHGRALPVLPLAVPLAALLLTLGYGRVVLSRSQHPGAAPLRVAAIQDYSPGETASFVHAAALQTDEPDREELTRRAAAKGARLVVWSENCLGAAFTPGARADATAQLARALKTYLVVGYSEPAEPKSFNCAAIIAPDGSVKGVHRKIHLFLGEHQSAQPGQDARAFDTGLGRVGLEICFDSCYTDVTRRIARDGAQVIAMPNYDPPTPHGILHQLHAAMLPFRAVENRVPFVRADANGLSQIVDATGRIIGEAPLYAADALVGEVTLGDGTGTLFTRLGDWVAYLCLLMVFACLFTVARPKRAGRPRSQGASQPDRSIA